MREIKFRGRRVFIPHEWVYGSLLIDFESAAHDGRRITAIAYFDRFQRIAEVDPETVGQSTGLKDNNGKEIYEGDVLRLPQGGIVTCEFHGDSFHLYGLKKDCHRRYAVRFTYLDTYPKVIGNVHENPELLEEK